MPNIQVAQSIEHITLGMVAPCEAEYRIRNITLICRKLRLNLRLLPIARIHVKCHVYASEIGNIAVPNIWVVQNYGACNSWNASSCVTEYRISHGFVLY